MGCTADISMQHDSADVAMKARLPNRLGTDTAQQLQRTTSPDEGEKSEAGASHDWSPQKSRDEVCRSNTALVRRLVKVGACSRDVSRTLLREATLTRSDTPDWMASYWSHDQAAEINGSAARPLLQLAKRLETWRLEESSPGGVDLIGRKMRGSGRGPPSDFAPSIACQH